MKAYEATLTIDGKLTASATASSVYAVIDDVINTRRVLKAKTIKIEVKEI